MNTSWYKFKLSIFPRMQKFTVFSILISISIVLIVVDIVGNDYLGKSTAEEVINIEETFEEGDNPEVLDEEVDLSSEEFSLELLEVNMNEDMLVEAGFLEPVLKDTIFSGLVFQFITFADQTSAFIHQWNVFEGENYVGSFYEMKYPTDTGAFQGYLSLRERATALYEIGEVNEVNNYGDASFYFNHFTKTKTVHVVIRNGKDIYAFEYAYSNHDKMKKVLNIVSAY